MVVVAIRRPVRAGLTAFVRVVGVLSLLLAAIVLAVPAGAGATVHYGISGDTQYGAPYSFAKCSVVTWPCPNSSYPTATMQGWGVSGQGNASFQSLKTGLPLQYVRFFVPYDALFDYNPSTGQCQPSPADQQGAVAFGNLYNEIKQAEADGLAPEVVITDGTGIGGSSAPPVDPDPTYGTASSHVAGFTNGGYDYSCGVNTLMYYTTADGAPVYEWEAFNEPDSRAPYNGNLSGECASGTSNPCAGTYSGYLCGSNLGECGPLEAAGLWDLINSWASYWTTNGSGFSTEYAAAGTFNEASVNAVQNYNPGSNYIAAYMSELVPNYGHPAEVAFHPYADVAASGADRANDASGTTQTISAINYYEGTQPNIWLTEAAGNLMDGTSNYVGSAKGCLDPDGDGKTTLGGCLDGNATAQYYAARGFLHLGTVSQVTRLFWYHFMLQNYKHAWDSALLDSTGNPRNSFCGLLAWSGCTGDPWAYENPNGNDGSPPPGGAAVVNPASNSAKQSVKQRPQIPSLANLPRAARAPLPPGMRRPK
jgi:hypothetical protein